MRRRLPILQLVAAALSVVVLVALGSVADAQDGGFLSIRKVDSSDPANTTVDFVWTGGEGEVGNATLTQNGEQAQMQGRPGPFPGNQGVALVFDSSPAMDKDGGLAASREAALQMIEDNPDTYFAIVQAGDTAEIRQDFTDDGNRLRLAIEGSTVAGSTGVGGIGPTEKGAVWNALRLAGSLYTTDTGIGSTLQPNVVLMVASNDVEGAANAPAARGALGSAGATLWTVGRLDTGLDITPYAETTALVGGQVLTADSAQGLSAPIAQAGQAAIQQEYRLTYSANIDEGQIAELELTVGGQTSDASVLVGGVTQGNQSLRPAVVEQSQILELFGNPVVFGLGLILALVATIGVAYGLTSLFVRDDLNAVLQPYSDPYALEESEDDGSLSSKSALIARAVELTEQVAENQGMLSKVETSLERANIPLRSGEALFFYVSIVIVVTGLGILVFRNLLGAVVLGAIAAMFPLAAVNFMAGQRRKKFMAQLPDTLSLLSGTLKAGYSLMQGVEAVSQEVEDPMGVELRRVVAEARLGRPLEESLEESAERMNSPDFAWAVMAIRIQREVGGNLSELLLTVADTMVARERLRREVAALTAEGRMSAIILGLLPLGLGVVMYVINPEYVGVLFSDPVGIGMLILAIIAMLIGFFWMKKIITIEI